MKFKFKLTEDVNEERIDSSNVDKSINYDGKKLNIARKKGRAHTDFDNSFKLNKFITDRERENAFNNENNSDSRYGIQRAKDSVRLEQPKAVVGYRQRYKNLTANLLDYNDNFLTALRILITRNTFDEIENASPNGKDRRGISKKSGFGIFKLYGDFCLLSIGRGDLMEKPNGMTEEDYNNERLSLIPDGERRMFGSDSETYLNSGKVNYYDDLRFMPNEGGDADELIKAYINRSGLSYDSESEFKKAQQQAEFNLKSTKQLLINQYGVQLGRVFDSI